ncbi:MAG: HlyD family type I secretion periplasmic adaptor subunit [Flavobacteriaceae bacterium]
MRQHREDLAFTNDVRAAVAERGTRGGWVQIFVVALALAAALGWASYATLDEVTSGQGTVIPSSQTQVVQSLEPGIVRAIEVREGDLVEEGQVLLRIDDTAASSDLGELRERRNAIEALVARLEAEAGGAEAMAVDPALEEAAPDRVAAEKASFLARRQRVAQEEAVLQLQLSQRRQELNELKAREEKLVATRTPLAREVELTQQLRKRGVVPEIDMLRLERQLAEVDGEIAYTRAGIPRAEAAIDEAEARFAAAGATVRAEAREGLAKARAELAVLEESRRGASDRVTRTVLRSPARGIVNKVSVTSIGAVVQPGTDIVAIIPVDDTLLVEAEVRPKDVAFIRPGQPARVKLTAYDYLIYGSLKGTVERVSADTFATTRGETFYRVVVRTEGGFADRAGNELPIIPGMTGTVDIQTGERTVLQYVLKPLNRMRHEALRER